MSDNIRRFNHLKHFRKCNFRYLRDIFYFIATEEIPANADNYLVLAYHIINSMYVAGAITENTKDILINMIYKVY